MDDLKLNPEEMAGVNVGALANMTVGRSLRYDHTQYIDFQEFLNNLHDLPKRKRKVKKSELSVNGRVVADSMERYLAAEGESSSALKQALVTPRHYLIYKDPRITRDGKHFQLGTFCHMAFLQPDLFGKVRVEPKLGRNTTKGMIGLIGWYWEQLGIAPEYDLRGMKMPELTRTLLELEGRFADAGLQRVTEDDATKIDIIRKTFKTYGGGILPELLRLADAETSFYGVDPSTGLKVKIRPDAMLLEENVGANIIVSFKTTSSDTIEGFARDAARYKYDLSEGMYLDVASHITGRQFVGTIMVVLQTVEPWQVFVLWWSPEDLESGKYKYRQAMEVIAQCREKRSFPGYDARAEQGAHGIIQFDLPKYARLALPEQNIETANTTDNA